MAEIAAAFANKASNGMIPSSFNKVCKKHAKGEFDDELMKQLSDLSWYSRVRELRTEWCHHSTIFVGGPDEDPILCVRSARRLSDQILLKGDIQINPRELTEWSRRATQSIDGFGSVIFTRFIAKSLPLEQQIYTPFYDELGFPK